MVVLLAHIILAAGHIVFVMVRRQASDSWDSISELIALSQNSRPSYIALANTAAGITERRTYGRMARIRATSTIYQPDNGHVELVFEGPDGQIDQLEMFDSTCCRGTGREKQSIPTEVKDDEEEVGSMRNHLNQELDNTQLEPVARQQWTWPRNPADGPPRDRSSPRHVSRAGQSPPPHSRTGSRERLIAQGSVRARRPASGELVRVNQAYG